MIKMNQTVHEYVNRNEISVAYTINRELLSRVNDTGCISDNPVDYVIKIEKALLYTRTSYIGNPSSMILPDIETLVADYGDMVVYDTMEGALSAIRYQIDMRIKNQSMILDKWIALRDSIEK